MLLIHKSLETAKEESPGGGKNKKKNKEKTLGVGFLFGDLGCRNSGQPYFFFLKLTQSTSSKIILGRKGSWRV